MPSHIISDVHEWSNEVPTVPGCIPAKPQPWERAWKNQRGKKTLLSFTLVGRCRVIMGIERNWEGNRQCNTSTSCITLLTRWNASRIRANFMS